MISHKHKCIFIHIPKTGGSSIEKSLGMKLSHHDHNHYLKKIKSNDVFTFSVVRNSFNKAVSDYKWILRGRNRNPIKKMFAKKGFKYFVNTYYNLEYSDIQNFKNLGWFNHHYLTHRRLQLDMLNPISKVDFIIRFENLQEDFDIVCDKIGIPRQELPHKNKTKHKHHTEYYDDETREIVAEKFAKDIEYFGFKFGE